MTTVTKTPKQNRKALEDFFFYEVKIENGVVEVHAYPIFDQDCSTRANLDTHHSVHTTIKGSVDVEDDIIADVAFMDEGIIADYGFSVSYLWDEALDTLDKLGATLKEQGKI